MLEDDTKITQRTVAALAVTLGTKGKFTVMH